MATQELLRSENGGMTPVLKIQRFDLNQDILGKHFIHRYEQLNV